MSAAYQVTIVRINHSEEGIYDGQICKVIDVKSDQFETDYRLITENGEEIWIPAENVTVIA